MAALETSPFIELHSWPVIQFILALVIQSQMIADRGSNGCHCYRYRLLLLLFSEPVILVGATAKRPLSLELSIPQDPAHLAAHMKPNTRIKLLLHQTNGRVGPIN